MDQPGTEKAVGKTRILVAPLDWGLGHATRCIPLIRLLVDRHCDVWIAAEGAQEWLLKTEFPDLPFLHLPGYRVRYARTATGLMWQMIAQWRRLNRAIKNENAWLQAAVSDYAFDAVISDNRYGLYNKAIPSIFITHQLAIKSPLGSWSESLLQRMNYRYINRFNECWVPDDAGPSNLAGRLSHPPNLPAIPLKYIGPVSRFEKKNFAEIKGHLLFVLSGPEPQRSILENKVLNSIAGYNGTATIVRGLPGDASVVASTNRIDCYNHLPADQLNNEIAKAEFVICRSGYSSVMDLALLQKKCILIPTPGQTEQEYIGRYLHQKNLAYCVTQRDFMLETALRHAKEFPYHFENPGNCLPETMTAFLGSLGQL